MKLSKSVVKKHLLSSKVSKYDRVSSIVVLLLFRLVEAAHEIFGLELILCPLLLLLAAALHKELSLLWVVNEHELAVVSLLHNAFLGPSVALLLNNLGILDILLHLSHLLLERLQLTQLLLDVHLLLSVRSF